MTNKKANKQLFDVLFVICNFGHFRSISEPIERIITLICDENMSVINLHTETLQSACYERLENTLVWHVPQGVGKCRIDSILHIS